jgi:hypothetical protein
MRVGFNSCHRIAEYADVLDLDGDFVAGLESEIVRRNQTRAG